MAREPTDGATVRVLSAVEADQATRDGQTRYAQTRLGEYPGEPDIAIDEYLGPAGKGYVIREHGPHPVTGRPALRLLYRGVERRAVDWTETVWTPGGR